jgi:hypothetical protein
MITLLKSLESPQTPGNPNLSPSTYFTNTSPTELPTPSNSIDND